jgi:hypothetical protein
MQNAWKDRTFISSIIITKITETQVYQIINMNL